MIPWVQWLVGVGGLGDCISYVFSLGLAPWPGRVMLLMCLFVWLFVCLSPSPIIEKSAIIQMSPIIQKSRIRETKHLSTDADSSTDAIGGWTKAKSAKKKLFLRCDFRPLPNKNVQMLDHFFPLLFPKNSKSLKILDIRLWKVGSKIPLKKTKNLRRPKK